jgi:UDP-N-acetylmuramoyl-tripeptide--D-alanyl-D-alanine ligase
MAAGITQQVTYGSANAQYIGQPLMDGVFLTVRVGTGEEETMIHTRLVGEYNYPNVMTAVAAGLHFGVPMADIKQAIEAYAPDNSRSQWLQKGTNQVILDAYNANPSSMKLAIENFAQMPGDQKILFLGGMMELGEESEKEHKNLIELIIDYLVLLM